jgi:4-amino-4-deoxychorismate lyase
MILVNGVANAMIQPSDRGLSYGDGVFRTLLLRDALNGNWRRQYAKLASDCARLRIACPDATLFEQDFVQLGSDAGAIKLIVTRGAGQRGYMPSELTSPTRIVSAAPLPVYPPQCARDGVAVRVCGLRLSRQPLLAGIKHLNRLENVLARSEWQDPDIMEGLLLDDTDHVIGGTMTNLFAVRGNVLHTPDLSNSGIAGVTRERIMGYAANLGLAVSVGQLSLNDLYASDEVMLCNSLIGIWQIRELERKKWLNGRYTALLRTLLETIDD